MRRRDTDIAMMRKSNIYRKNGFEIEHRRMHLIVMFLEFNHCGGINFFDILDLWFMARLINCTRTQYNAKLKNNVIR